MKYIFGISLLIAAFFSAQPVVAGDLTVSRAVLEDKTGTLTITDVAGREFTPIGPTLSKGFTRTVYWVRLRLRAPAKGNEVALFIRQPFLNEIRLYEAGAGDPSAWKTRVTGNHYPYGDRDRARNSLGFVVHVPAPESTYYLRLKTATQVQLSVVALEPSEADHLDNRFDLLEVLFATAMLLLLLWAVHSYWMDRLPVVGLFAVHQAVYTLYGLAITGYLAPWVPAGLLGLADLFGSILYCGVGFTTLLFCRELFKPYEPSPVLMRGLNLLLAVFPLQLAAMALGYAPLAVIVNAVLVRAIWWYFVIMTFTFRREQTPSRRFLQLIFITVTLAFYLFWVLSSSMMSTTIYIGRQILIANGLLIGGLFAMILNARSRRLLLEAQQSALDLRIRSEFLALVSHEIRTPLNALVGFSSLARTASDPAKIDQYLAILEQSSRNLMELVSGILDMSKIEAGRIEFESVPFNLRQLVAGLEEQYLTLAYQKRLTYRTVMADTVPVWVMGDPVRLRQILANLISNAVKFTERGMVSCSIGLTGRSEDDGHPLVRFEVRDTGIGIPEAGRARLFQPFRQLDPTISRKFGGTGLGLAIVHRLVEMMGGRITVDSREGEGSRFTVDVPLPETDPAPEAPAVSTAFSSHEVLIVEDNGFNRRLLGDILTSWGQRVMPAEDGRQALQLLEQQRYDLILLDIRMPDIDGIEVARRIRRRENERSEPPVPIIAITADADAATREACLGAGINAVLAKPVIPEQLAKTVAAHWVGTGAAPIVEQQLLNERTCNDLGNDPERARQYREMLLLDIDEELQSLQSALERNDRNDLGRAAHTLKGLCGHLASREPAELVAWLQANAASGPPEQVGRVMEQLRTICQCGTAREDTP